MFLTKISNTHIRRIIRIPRSPFSKLKKNETLRFPKTILPEMIQFFLWIVWSHGHVPDPKNMKLMVFKFFQNWNWKFTSPNWSRIMIWNFRATLSEKVTMKMPHQPNPDFSRASRTLFFLSACRARWSFPICFLSTGYRTTQTGYGTSFVSCRGASRYVDG